MENTIKLFNSFSIPTRSIWSLIGFIAICGFGYLQFVHFLIPGFTEIFSYNEWDNPIDISTSLKLMWVPILAYIIVGTGISLLFSIFKKLSKFNKKGLIRGLIRGFIMGLALGFIIGLIMGGLIMGLALGFIISLTFSLIVGFIMGPTLLQSIKK